jgi:hypothetical protein
LAFGLQAAAVHALPGFFVHVSGPRMPGSMPHSPVLPQLLLILLTARHTKLVLCVRSVCALCVLFVCYVRAKCVLCACSVCACPPSPSRHGDPSSLWQRHCVLSPRLCLTPGGSAWILQQHGRRWRWEREQHRERHPDVTANRMPSGGVLHGRSDLGLPCGQVPVPAAKVVPLRLPSLLAWVLLRYVPTIGVRCRLRGSCLLCACADGPRCGWV